MRRVIAAILLITALLPLPAYASKVETKKKELGNVKTTIEASKKALEATTKEKESVEAELIYLDGIIVQVEDELEKINQDLETKAEELEASQEALELAKEEREQQYEAAKERIESMYKNQKVGYMQVIFTSTDFWEMLNRMEYIRKIAQYDQVMLENMEDKQEEVEMRTAQLEAEKQDIALLYKEQVGMKAKLGAAKKEKDSILEKLEIDEESLHLQIEDMVKISKDLEGEIKKLTQESTLKYTGGQFLWPVPGQYRISSTYGSRVHPISKKRKVHTGLDIAAPFGKSVVAAADGKVIRSGWMGGYGNTVMIDHGSGYVSLYAHNSSNTVSVGQSVTRGSQIAKIGSTGYSTGNHLHFEIRLNGAHKNPQNYLK